MTNKPKTARERLMERLAQPIPRVKPLEEVLKERALKQAAKERERAVEHNCEVLNLDPRTRRGLEGKRWRVEVDKVTAAVPMEVTPVEEALRRAIGEAARQRRLWALADPLGVFGGTETIDDVVKRQDETR